MSVLRGGFNRSPQHILSRSCCIDLRTARCLRAYWTMFNDRFGSDSEILAAIRCFPFLLIADIEPRGRHVRIVPILLQKSFCRRCQKFQGLLARWCNDLRTSSPHTKLIGDFGSATEAIRIIHLFAFQVFAKNSDRCNFRLLQQYRG